ncbi:Spectrin beta chain [Schistosoma japonicum]|nr:Spectrin beta chain [Schistosoma japonicum]
MIYYTYSIQYLNVLHNPAQVNTKIDEANLRMCETYNSIASTLMLTDYLDDIIEPNEDKQHEMNRNKETEPLFTVLTSKLFNSTRHDDSIEKVVTLLISSNQ